MTALPAHDSVVVPTFNEADNVHPLLTRIAAPSRTASAPRWSSPTTRELRPRHGPLDRRHRGSLFTARFLAVDRRLYRRLRVRTPAPAAVPAVTEAVEPVPDPLG
ncbi:hypothetical protein [Streptomyces sp. NPDC005890]|uniref:hypothetical protein n=1 Tax=Streptomyces sp. NPDC005890 TaxID=3154568 RepID=UPI0034004754